MFFFVLLYYMQKNKCSYFEVILTLTKHSAKHWNWSEGEENFRIADSNQKIHHYIYVVVCLEPCSCRSTSCACPRPLELSGRLVLWLCNIAVRSWFCWKFESPWIMETGNHVHNAHVT